jgi:hypothetical protein
MRMTSSAGFPVLESVDGSKAAPSRASIGFAESPCLEHPDKATASATTIIVGDFIITPLIIEQHNRPPQKVNAKSR